MKQKIHGGVRLKAGYKGKYTESTVLVSLRVPKSLETEVRDKIKKICEPLIKITVPRLARLGVKKPI
jgi:hypothetical protein